MLKKVYSVSLDSDEVKKFKNNNVIKLSTFLNSMLIQFNRGQVNAVNSNNIATINKALLLEQKIDKLIHILDIGQELK